MSRNLRVVSSVLYGHAAQPSCSSFMFSDTTAPLLGQQVSMLHPPAQIVGIKGVEHAFSASGVLGSSVRAHSVSSQPLTAAFPGEPLTLEEAVCWTCLASSFPRHLQEVSVATRRVSVGARCTFAAVMDRSSIFSRSVNEAIYSPKALCYTVTQTFPLRVFRSRER
jgi:hypothetical protein